VYFGKTTCYWHWPGSEGKSNNLHVSVCPLSPVHWTLCLPVCLSSLAQSVSFMWSVISPLMGGDGDHCSNCIFVFFTATDCFLDLQQLIHARLTPAHCVSPEMTLRCQFMLLTSVRDVKISWSQRLEYFKNNFTEVSLGCSFFAYPNITDLLQRVHPKILARRGAGNRKNGFQHSHALISLKWSKIGPRLLLRTNFVYYV